MAQCIHCGGELPEGAAFCPHCETILTEKAAAKPPRLWRKTLLLGGILGCLGDLLPTGQFRPPRRPTSPRFITARRQNASMSPTALPIICSFLSMSRTGSRMPRPTA